MGPTAFGAQAAERRLKLGTQIEPGVERLQDQGRGPRAMSKAVS